MMEPAAAALSNTGLAIQRLETSVHMLRNDGWMTFALVELDCRWTTMGYEHKTTR